MSDWKKVGLSTYDLLNTKASRVQVWAVQVYLAGDLPWRWCAELRGKGWWRSEGGARPNLRSAQRAAERALARLTRRRP
jgi:hypothetical protein